jgi:hypothetical protein
VNNGTIRRRCYNMETKVCCICGKEFTGYGNNPSPLKDKDGKDYPEGSVCCKECDAELVVPTRIRMIVDSWVEEHD